MDQPLDALADWRRAETLLRDARAALPGRLEPAVALYKIYAYSNRQDQALVLIDEVLTEAAAQAGFPADWRGLGPASAAWAQASGPVRIYLYSLKVRGFVLLRMAQPEAAREVLLKLMELDPRDQVGGSVVLDIAQGVLEDRLEAAA